MGDVNIAFFHFVVRQRRSINFVARIKQDSGAWIEDLDDIKHSAVDFFAKLFTSDREDRC